MLLAGVVAVGIVVALVGHDRSSTASAQPGPTRCDGSIGAVSVAGAVRVPAGSTCALVRTSVDGDVRVDPGGALFALGASISGSLVSGGADFIVIGNAAEFGDPEQATVIGGTVSITGTTSTAGFLSANVICDATVIRGALIVAGNRAPFSIGNDTANCGYPGTGAVDGNSIGGSVKISDNRFSQDAFPGGQIAVLGNAVVGRLQCLRNVPPVTNEDPGSGDVDVNSVRGGKIGQCTGL